MDNKTSKRKCGFLLSEVLPFNLPALSILDVGALLEGTPVYDPLLEASDARVYGFEPNPVARDQLREQFGRQGVWFADVLGDGSNRQFYQTYYPGCASLFEPDPDTIQAFYGMGTDKNMNFNVERQTEVLTSRLDELADIPSIDFAKLDVQGAELMVLQNGMSKLGAALVIQSEASFLPLYREQPLFADQHLFLRQHGFEFHKFIDVTGRSFSALSKRDPTTPMSQLIEADAIFVRGLTQPSNLSQEQLLKAAQILHDAYCSYDLAARFLTEYDRRALMPVAHIYRQAVAEKSPEMEIMLLNIKAGDKHSVGS